MEGQHLRVIRAIDIPAGSRWILQQTNKSTSVKPHSHSPNQCDIKIRDG